MACSFASTARLGFDQGRVNREISQYSGRNTRTQVNSLHAHCTLMMRRFRSSPLSSLTNNTMWTSRRIKLALTGCALLMAGAVVGFAVGHIGTAGEERVPPSSEKPKLAEMAGVAVPQFQTPPPPVSAGSVAAQQMSPPVYIQVQPVQQPMPVLQQPVMQEQVIQQPPPENYWADRPVGRNGLIGNPSADPPSAHGYAYSRAY